MDDTRTGVVSTIEKKCKQCYACIRNCPAKAIAVRQGQAWVMQERCVACGNCVRICAQRAKRIQDGVAPTHRLLSGPDPVCLVLAPSFPAAFADIEPLKLVAAAKKIGFAKVLEVAFGAELVSIAYKRILDERKNTTTPIIATPCPTLVKYIQKYHPDLIPFLAPVVSPMIAVARMIKRRYLPGAKVVFAGPCVSKKLEREDPEVDGEIDSVLTFEELQQMFDEAGIKPEELESMPFDGPAAYLGRIFPVSSGLLRTAGLQSDVLNDDFVVSEGRDRVMDVIDSIEKESTRAKFFDLLFCEGCINGPIMPTEMNVTERKERIAAYVRDNSRLAEDPDFKRTLEEYSDIDMSRDFKDERVEVRVPTEEDIQAILHEIKKDKPEDELNCGACGYKSCREKAIAVFQGIAENEMCLPFIIDRLTEYNEKFKEAQQKIFRVEKLASVGRLAAGIAHEINNPLSGILLFANILDRSIQDVEQKSKLKSIIDETIRCREIVKGVLDFSRQTSPKFEPLNIIVLLDRVFDLLEKQDLFKDIVVEKPYAGKTLPLIEGDKMQLQQVFLNIIINAVQAITGHGTITVDASESEGHIDISVKDTGCGISEEDIDRIFDPFFTTKEKTKGTGLGLSLSHGIIDKHNGTMHMESKLGEGSKLTIRLPVAA